ncbi:PREDICTED: uncharacterized protein LOC108574499 [Habropoda laboriosa]|uniref:uncharacterized protein LOC108574499 n=1 Tax=Habropoda laboriosa TaxID=597456 RepID=UPI00083DB16E|nr:PREDICTED: uncharacterized protein LOC108574499 [Habropoda laboriosa]
MPAEIDTGGPTVLHCDYRADCPIPIVASASTESSLRQENRVVGTSIVRRLPRIDENESLDDRALKSHRWSGFSSRRTRGTSARSGFRGFRRTKSCITFSNFPTHQQPDDALSRTIQCESLDYHQNVSRPEQPESRLHDTTVDQSSIDQDTTITRTRSRRTGESSLDEYQGNRGLDTRIPVPSRKHENGTGDYRQRYGEEGSWCFERSELSTTAGNWPRFHVADRVRIGKAASAAARFSSQSGDPLSSDRTTYEKLVPTSTLPSLADETWKEVNATNSWGSESRRVTKVVPSTNRQTDFPLFDHDDSLTRSSGRRTRKKRRECSNNRSTYIQLALLLFLVAFGQCRLRKSSVFNCSAKPSTTGLSVLAIGTVISAVSAAPVDLMGDAGVRAERSANLSHITGASRKIQMYIKNRHLQILPDGTVNGSNDDTSDYKVMQLQGMHTYVRATQKPK